MSDIFRKVIHEVVEENSQVSQAAKAQGLEYMKFGRYGKDGKVTHKSQNGKLVKVTNVNTQQPAKQVSRKTAQKNMSRAGNYDNPSSPDYLGYDDEDAPEQPTNDTPSIHTPASKATHPYKKTGNIYRSVSDSIESSGFSSTNSADSKALIKNGMVPLRVKGPAPRTWRRGDGAQHKEWTTIEPSYDWNGVDKVVKKNPEAVSKTLDSYIEKIGAKHIGQVSGEFGSSKKTDVYASGDTIFVHRGNRIEVGNKKRFKNDKVWRK
jgi:hypothetical protein